MKPGKPIEPNHEWVEPYKDLRQRFQQLYPALKALR